MVKKEVEKLLKKVQKPARYTGGELNSVIKDKNSVKLRYAFCFPDNYEIGMSHLGMKILYSVVNEREDAWCERVFAPWDDKEIPFEKAAEKGTRKVIEEYSTIGVVVTTDGSFSDIPENLPRKCPKKPNNQYPLWQNGVL